MSENRKHWICSTLDVAGGKRVESGPTSLLPMGVADRAKLWAKGSDLKIRFMQGTPALHARTLKAAHAWLVDGVKLTLREARADEKPDLRIAYDPDGGSWSYIGTDNTTIHPSQATMNLGWASLDASDEDFDSVVIHEFGHALGLLHEHNHPGAKIEWDRAAVYAELGGDPNYWDRRTVDANVFEAFEAAKLITTDFDQVSVMIYPIQPNWTTNGVSFTPSPRLSKGDAATIKKLYG